MSYTVEDVKSYVTENQDEIQTALNECKEIPDFLKNVALFKPVWQSGCWLGKKLKEHGASDEEVESIGFAHGQRCFGNDPFKMAIRYMNEYLENGSVKDKPGQELAEKIFKEQIVRN